MNAPKYTVMGVNDWPEFDQKDFEITDVRETESFHDAILRAQNSYSPDLQCYIVDQNGDVVQK